jgi:hypothetical protein
MNVHEKAPDGSSLGAFLNQHKTLKEKTGLRANLAAGF